MNITYTDSYNNFINSQLAFDELFPEWKRKLRNRSVVISIPLLLILLYAGYRLHMGFIINGAYYPRASLVFNLVWSIPVCIFFGRIAYQGSLNSRMDSLRNFWKSLPADYFGQTVISFDAERVLITRPWRENKYSWKMVDSIKVSKDFLFFCLGNLLLFSIPTSVLGSQPTEFVAQVESLMAKSQSTATSGSN